jgi:hypothetical protein
MLVRPAGDAVIAIGQLSHSWLSGQLARCWGNERFGGLDRREEIALGAEQHDIGWAAFDLEPRLNADTGAPRTFLELTLDEYLGIWRTAPDRLLTQSALAALVVSLHGRALSELRLAALPDEDAVALQAHVTDELARQRDLRAALGLSDSDTRRIQRQMWTWDGLSLALCHGWRPFVSRDVPAAGEELVDVELRDLGNGAATLDPWPLCVERLEARVEGRRLAGGYASETELRAAYASAPPAPIEFALEAA